RWGPRARVRASQVSSDSACARRGSGRGRTPEGPSLVRGDGRDKPAAPRAIAVNRADQAPTPPVPVLPESLQAIEVRDQSVTPSVFGTNQTGTHRILTDVSEFLSQALTVAKPVIEKITLPRYSCDLCHDSFIIANE